MKTYTHSSRMAGQMKWPPTSFADSPFLAPSSERERAQRRRRVLTVCAAFFLRSSLCANACAHLATSETRGHVIDMSGKCVRSTAQRTAHIWLNKDAARVNECGFNRRPSTVDGFVPLCRVRRAHTRTGLAHDNVDVVGPDWGVVSRREERCEWS